MDYPIKIPAKDFCSEDLDVRRCSRCSVSTVVNGSLNLAAREIVLQAFLLYLAIQGATTEFCCAGQIHRT